jgi:hypothetical protein
MTVTARGLGVLAGIFWLALAVPAFLLAPITLLVGSEGIIELTAIGFASLVVATALILKPTDRPRLIASVVLGLLFAILAVLISLRSGDPFSYGIQFIGYAVLAAVTALISAIAASDVFR